MFVMCGSPYAKFFSRSVKRPHDCMRPKPGASLIGPLSQECCVVRMQGGLPPSFSAQIVFCISSTSFFSGYQILIVWPLFRKKSGPTPVNVSDITTIFPFQLVTVTSMPISAASIWSCTNYPATRAVACV